MAVARRKGDRRTRTTPAPRGGYSIRSVPPVTVRDRSVVRPGTGPVPIATAGDPRNVNAPSQPPTIVTRSPGACATMGPGCGFGITRNPKGGPPCFSPSSQWSESHEEESATDFGTKFQRSRSASSGSDATEKKSNA